MLSGRQIAQFSLVAIRTHRRAVCVQETSIKPVPEPSFEVHFFPAEIVDLEREGYKDVRHVMLQVGLFPGHFNVLHADSDLRNNVRMKAMGRERDDYPKIFDYAQWRAHLHLEKDMSRRMTERQFERLDFSGCCPENPTPPLDCNSLPHHVHALYRELETMYKVSWEERRGEGVDRAFRAVLRAG